MARSSASRTPLKKVLIIGASWVGDAVLSQPLLRYLKSSHDCTIDVLAPSWTQGVLLRMPEVNRVIDSPLIHKQLNFIELWRCAQRVKDQYDTAILLPNSLKSALIPWMARIPTRIGYRREGRSLFLSHPLELDKKQHPLMVERFLALSGASIKFNEQLNPTLQANLSEQQAALDALKLNLSLPPIVLCPGAEYGPAKRWPIDHFKVLAQALILQNKQVWLMGSPKDQQIAQSIIEHIQGPIINLCGKTNLAQAVDLMALAHAVVTNDSGLMHVAAALKRPLIALFGSSSPQFTPPLFSVARVLSRSLPCSPCFERDCPLGHLNCLTEITPNEVIDALARLEEHN